MPCDASAVLSALQERASTTSDPDALADAVVRAVKATMPKASWVGVYWLKGQHLELGPYVGPATDHVRIPVGTGVCGTAVLEDADQIVPDVRERGNYLACSPDVRSEIVVLIRSRGQVVGQIDIDSPTVGAFDPVDHCVLRAVADSFGGLLAATSR